MSKELVIRKQGYDLAKPEQMASMAMFLKKLVVKQKLFTPIQGKNYVHVEGWQVAGGLMGTFPRVVAVENMSSGSEIKWKAEVEIVALKDGKIISRGFAVCSNKENRKKAFDEYAVLSMAQTRAVGKAYRNTLGWVMKLAGYEGTPSEEMTKMGETRSESAPADVVPPDDDAAELVCHGLTKSGCGNELSRQEYDYSKKIYGKPLCREHQKGAKPLKK